MSSLGTVTPPMPRPMRAWRIRDAAWISAHSTAGLLGEFREPDSFLIVFVSRVSRLRSAQLEGFAPRGAWIRHAAATRLRVACSNDAEARAYWLRPASS